MFSKIFIFVLFLLFMISTNTGQVKTRLSSKLNIFFKENNLKVSKRDIIDELTTGPTHSTLNELVKNAFADYKSKLSDLYQKFNTDLSQVVSLDEELFAEFKTNIKHEINLNQVAISEQIVNFEVYKSETNLEPDRTALVNVIKIENGKDLQHLLTKSEEFESNLNQNLLNNDISDKYSTIELVNRLFKHAHKYLSKLKSDEMNSMLDDTNVVAANNNNKLEIVMSRSDKFRLRKQDEIDMLRGIFEQRAEMSETSIDIFLQMLALHIDNLKTSLDSKHDQLNADLVQSFSLLNANVLGQLNATFANLIEKITNLYPKETSLTLKQLNQTITNSFDQFKFDLVDMHEQDELNLNKVIASDEQLFREFTENILDNIKLHGIQGHINESLIKYEANKSFSSLELDREAYRNQLRDESLKSLHEFIIKLNQSEHELKQNLTQIDFNNSVETLSLMSSYYETIDSLYKFKLSEDLADWEEIKLASDEFKLRKQDETNMLRELLQNHAAHSELFVSADQRQNHTIFVNFLQEEIDSFKRKLEQKHEKMLSDLKANLNESSWKLVESFNSTHHELIETIKKLYALYQTDVSFQVDFTKLKEEESNQSDSQEASLNSTQEEELTTISSAVSDSTDIVGASLSLVDGSVQTTTVETTLGLDDTTSQEQNELSDSIETTTEVNKEIVDETTPLSLDDLNDSATEKIEPTSTISLEDESANDSTRQPSYAISTSTTDFSNGDEPVKNIDPEETTSNNFNEETTLESATNIVETTVSLVDTTSKNEISSESTLSLENEPSVHFTTQLGDFLSDTATTEVASQQSYEDTVIVNRDYTTIDSIDETTSESNYTTTSSNNENLSITIGSVDNKYITEASLEENQESSSETTSLSLDSSTNLSEQTNSTTTTISALPVTSSIIKDANSVDISYPKSENLIVNSPATTNEETKLSSYDSFNEDQQTNSFKVGLTTSQNEVFSSVTTTNNDDNHDDDDERLEDDSSDLIEFDDSDDDDETKADNHDLTTDSAESKQALENLYRELIRMSASNQDELDPLEKSALTQKLPQTNIIDYLQFNQGIKCVTGFLFKYTNNETKLIGKQGIVEKKITLFNRQIQSLKKLVIKGMDFIQICLSDLLSGNRTCEIIRNKYKKINVIDFDLEALKQKTSKSYEVLGLFGSYDNSIKCVSKIGVIYKEIKANLFAGVTRLEAATQKIKYINFNLDRECIKGLEQVYGENDVVKVGLPGTRKRKIEFENKELVSLKMSQSGGRSFIEFCFFDTELDEITCDKIKSTYESLSVSEFNLDALNGASKARYEAIGLNGSFDKTKNCLKKLEVEYKAMCGTRDTLPC